MCVCREPHAGPEGGVDSEACDGADAEFGYSTGRVGHDNNDNNEPRDH